METIRLRISVMGCLLPTGMGSPGKADINCRCCCLYSVGDGFPERFIFLFRCLLKGIHHLAEFFFLFDRNIFHFAHQALHQAFHSQETYPECFQCFRVCWFQKRRSLWYSFLPVVKHLPSCEDNEYAVLADR